MDGTRLFFTTTLPPLPAGLTPPKSIWGGFTIPLLAALVLGTVVAILYRATPRAYSSPATVQTQTVSQKTSEVNQEPQPPASDTSEPPANASDESSVSDDASRDPFYESRDHRIQNRGDSANAGNPGVARRPEIGGCFIFGLESPETSGLECIASAGQKRQQGFRD
jgi:hypothetical protein